MRILRFFFLSLVGFLVVGLLIFFIGREMLLIWGSGMIKADYDSLRGKNYASECSRQFSYSQDYWAQIKFNSDRDYNLEVVCADFAASPIVLFKRKLPPLLSKTSIGSGFVIGDDKLPSFIELNAFGRKLFVYTDGEEIRSNYLSKPDLDYGQGPLSSCQSHGYQCCSLDLQSGLGEQMASVTDCPKSCYESCLLRPMILSFNSRPALDDQTRTVEISSGELLTMSYSIGNGKSDVFEGQLLKNEKTSLVQKLQTLFSKQQGNLDKDGIALPLEVLVDFGDGQFFQSENLQDTFDHSYICQTKLCFFQAKISVKDARSVLSIDNELAKMIIKVNK